MSTVSIISSEVFNRQKFDVLNSLCSDYKEVFHPDLSPSPELLNVFYGKFKKDEFVRALFSSGKLKKALSLLESGLAEMIDVRELAGSIDDDIKELKRREREVRFIHRLAKIMGEFGLGPVFIDLKRLRRLQKKMVKQMQEVEQNLIDFFSNDYFILSIPVRENVQLHRLQELLHETMNCVEQAQPEYPYQRNTNEDNTRFRVLIDRLTDSCLRIYGSCDVKILTHLTSYATLASPDGGLGSVDIAVEIRLARGRKIDAYERRLPKEDNESVDLYGEWVPARTLDPPWW